MAFPDIQSHDPESALLLYGCAFGGLNDAQFVRNAMVPIVTVIDIDQEAITSMAPTYPDGWNFICTDAILFACDMLERGHTFDLVVADPFGGAEMERAHEYLTTLQGISDMMLIIGARTEWIPPKGAKIIHRSDDYCWWVFE